MVRFKLLTVRNPEIWCVLFELPSKVSSKIFSESLLRFWLLMPTQSLQTPEIKTMTLFISLQRARYVFVEPRNALNTSMYYLDVEKKKKHHLTNANEFAQEKCASLESVAISRRSDSYAYDFWTLRETTSSSKTTQRSESKLQIGEFSSEPLCDF